MSGASPFPVLEQTTTTRRSASKSSVLKSAMETTRAAYPLATAFSQSSLDTSRELPVWLP